MAQKIKGEKRVALIVHIRPDGDTLGSALALKLALIDLGIGAEVVCDDPVPSRFLFLKEMATVKNTLDGDFSAIVAVDCADISRLGSFEKAFLSHKNTYAIDHHISNTRFAKNNYVADNSSNCENAFELIKLLGVEINEDIANLLMLGVITDTGNFRHKNVTGQTFSTAAELRKRGADVTTIYYNMFSAQTKERAKLFGKVMSKIRYFLDGKFAVATVRLADFTETGAKQDETEGFIDFVMGVRGVEIGACVMEVQPNKYKISFRSKTANVNAVAGAFGGGGHILASGCQISGEYEEVIDRITFAASREIPDSL
jgi:phosphoesterase RecJ-like protein